jgi:hypothetical protein
MIHVAIGEDTYGAVRRVKGTSIVTKFFMLQALPIYPLESYYLVRLGRKSGTGIPLVAYQTKRKIVGLPCRRINRLSVIVAYIRGVGAAMVLFPTIFFMGGAVMRLSNANFRPDKFAQLAAMVFGIVLALGLAFSLPSYILTFYVPSRERAIRLVCARVLGVAADLANVRHDVQSDIVNLIAEFLAQNGIADFNDVIRRPNSFDRNVLDVALVLTRIRLGRGDAPETREAETDTLLRAIEVVPDK